MAGEIICRRGMPPAAAVVTTRLALWPRDFTAQNEGNVLIIHSLIRIGIQYNIRLCKAVDIWCRRDRVHSAEAVFTKGIRSGRSKTFLCSLPGDVFCDKTTQKNHRNAARRRGRRLLSSLKLCFSGAESPLGRGGSVPIRALSISTESRDPIRSPPCAPLSMHRRRRPRAAQIVPATQLIQLRPFALLVS